MEPFLTLLRERGTNNVDLAVDGSETPVEYVYLPEKKAKIAEIRILLVDTTIHPTGFGSSATPLENGITVRLKHADGTLHPTLGAEFGFTSNRSFALWGEVSTPATTPPSPVLFQVRWMAPREHPALDIDAGGEFIFTVQDDLEGLDALYVLIRGEIDT
jgi:hypothetical protein